MRKEYQAAPAAPEALWRLALLHLVPDPAHYDPNEAEAILSTLPIVYPNAQRVPDALALGARLKLEAGRLGSARQRAFKALSGHPDHTVAARAWRVLAEAAFREGRVEDALVALARVQKAAETDPNAARDALAHARVLDRLLYASGRGEPVLALQTSGGAVLSAKASALVVDRAGTLYAAVPREGVILLFGADGQPAGRQAQAGVVSLAFDRWDRLWVASESGVLAPGGQPLSLMEGAEITAIAPVGPASAWVADAKAKAVYLVEAGAAPSVHARIGGRLDVVGLVATADGGAFVLDAKGRRLIHIGVDGVPIKEVALPERSAPVDLAADAFGHLYLLDAKRPALTIFSPAGDVMNEIALPAEGEHAMTRGAALAVAPDGSVAVHETRKRRLQWLR